MVDLILMKKGYKLDKKHTPKGSDKHASKEIESENDESKILCDAKHNLFTIDSNVSRLFGVRNSKWAVARASIAEDVIACCI